MNYLNVFLFQFTVLFSLMFFTNWMIVVIFRKSISSRDQYVIIGSSPIIAFIIALVARVAYVKTSVAHLFVPVYDFGSDVGITEAKFIYQNDYVFIVFLTISIILSVHTLIMYFYHKKTILYNSFTCEHDMCFHVDREGASALLIYSSAVKTPCCIGVLNQYIVFPVGYKKEHYDFALEHEKVHCMRHDPMIVLLLRMFTCFQWFNPIVYLYSILTRKYCEYACDEKVIYNLSFDDRKRYASAILDSAPRFDKVSVLPTFSSQDFLQSRLRRVIEGARLTKKTPIISIVACISIIALLVMNLGIFPTDIVNKRVVKNYGPEREVEKIIEYDEYIDDGWYAGELKLVDVKAVNYGIREATYSGELFRVE